MEENQRYFAYDFKEDLQEQKIYISIHWLGLYKVACRNPTFPCVDTISWIVSDTYPKTMTLSSANMIDLSIFGVEKFQGIYHLPKLVRCMDTLFYATHSQVNMRDIVKY